jgi:hypothetical protein
MSAKLGLGLIGKSLDWGVWEQGAEDNISAEEGWNDRRE